jgi:hypothetical protein
MAIGIVPHKLRKTKKLGQLHVDQLIWQLEKPSNALQVSDLGKNDLEGHNLRHKLISLDKSHTHKFLTPLGHAYKQFDHIVNALAPFRYSVIIENCIEPHYFTEKILNCLACKTIPIYWGHESVKQYFDTSNWLFFNDLEDGYEKIKFASSGEHIVSYDKIHENYIQTKSYNNFYKNISEKITE